MTRGPRQWLIGLVLIGLQLNASAVVFAQTSASEQRDPAKPAQTGEMVLDAEFDAAFGEESGQQAMPDRLIRDPLEPINRGVFWVNDKLYFYLLKPIARGYRLVLPRPARTSVGNFFQNLAMPIRASNALLQFKFRDFGTEIYRFVINTTFGIGGLFDPAKSIAGVRPAQEDFGQTLGFYGVGHGFYLVLPIVGPSSLRDGIGHFADSFADPIRYAGLETMEFVGVKFYDSTNRLSLDRDTYEGVVEDSLDPYLFIRNAYAQRRLSQVSQNSYNVYILRGPLFDSDLLDPTNWFGN